jgi:hypothetical protein
VLPSHHFKEEVPWPFIAAKANVGEQDHSQRDGAAVIISTIEMVQYIQFYE